MAKRGSTSEAASTAPEPEVIGGNARAMLEGYADRLETALDALAEAQEDKKTVLAEAKADGFNVQLLQRVIKERRDTAKKHASQLSLELEQTAYRKALGVETDLAKAQEAARREAELADDSSVGRSAKHRDAAGRSKSRINDPLGD